MPRLTKFLFMCAMVISVNFSKVVEVKCPDQCSCDFVGTLKRASCINQTLVVLQSLLPEQTELLDLSYNQISHLDDQVFFEEKLLSLRLLNMSHNKVSQIHMNAFEGLDHLRTLDLSHNAIRYLLVQWFWSLKSLQELYLRGNFFSKFNDEPIIESRTLKILDISKCAIASMGWDVFTKVPNLEYLDISENYLIQLEATVIRPLPNLAVFNVNNNSFSCNTVMEELSSYCIQKGVRYNDPCLKPPPMKSEGKFERIINAAPDIVTQRNSWIYEENEDESETIAVPTDCKHNTDTSKTEELSLLMRIINLSPVLSILIPFVYGIAIGIVIGCSVQIKGAKPKARLQENTYASFDDISVGHLRRNNSSFRKKDNSEARESLMLQEWNIAESTPMTQRKFPINANI